jgi:hypothetical protein
MINEKEGGPNKEAALVPRYGEFRSSYTAL